MIIDNFDLIKSLLKFEDKDDFYFCQIIQRKKDGNDVPAANNGYRTIKTYYIKSIEDLEKYKKAIDQLCYQNNARAYINLNVRNMKQIMLTVIKEAAALIEEDRCNQGFRLFDHCCGITPKKHVKRTWIVDIDTKNEQSLECVKKAINLCRSANNIDDSHYNNIIAEIPTLHGYHLITCGFDKSKLKQFIEQESNELKCLMPDEIDEICSSIKKDNPTILYINNEGNN